MKITVILISFVIQLFTTTGVYSQAPLIDRNGTAYFFSEAPLENIEAVNKQVLGAVDLQKGTVAVSMLMKGFRFAKSLMEEHFNENYVESDKYPKSTFEGSIKDFSSLNFKQPGSFEAEVEGEITIHGVTKPLSVKVRFDVTDAGIQASTSFMLRVADFGIEIPSLVVNNIAEEVEVTSLFHFSTTR